MDSSLTTLLSQKERELSALREQSLQELQAQVAQQGEQLKVLRSNFSFNLRLLEARDAELAALDAKLPAEEAKVSKLQHAVASLQTALASADAGARSELQKAEQQAVQWQEELRVTSEGMRRAQQRCRHLEAELQQCAASDARSMQDQQQQAKRDAVRVCKELERRQEQRITALEAEWRMRVSAAEAAARHWEALTQQAQQRQLAAQERQTVAEQVAAERRQQVLDLQAQLQAVGRQVAELGGRAQQLHRQQQACQGEARESRVQHHALQREREHLHAEKASLVQQLRQARQDSDSARQHLHEVSSEHSTARQQHQTLVGQLQAQLAAATEDLDQARRDARAAHAANQTSRCKMREWVSKWEGEWQSRLSHMQQQHKAAMRQAASELAQSGAMIPELHRQIERTAQVLQACQQEVHTLKAQAAAGAQREAQLQGRMAELAKDAEAAAESRALLDALTDRHAAAHAAIEEAEQRCAQRQADLDLLRRQLADVQQARAQPSQETSSSDLATATIPSPPGSPRSGVTYWLKGMKAARAAQPTEAVENVQQHAPPQQADQQHAAVGGSAPVLWEGPRQPGGSAAHHAAQHVHFSQAVEPRKQHGGPAHLDHAGHQRELAESQARVLRLQAENERLMEMGNELRAKQHRLELEAQQRHVQVAAAAPAWVHNAAGPMATHQPPVAAYDGAYAPQAHMMQTAMPAYVQQGPVSHPAMTTSAQEPLQPWHPNTATAAAHSLPLRTASTLQPFHPDHPNQSALSRQQTSQKPVSPIRKPYVLQDADGAVALEAAHMPTLDAVAGDEGDELAERLARIEALAERIAQSQLAATVPASVRPNARVPGLNSRASQRSPLVPATTNLQLDENVQSSSSSKPTSQRVLPAAASARSTASQRAKLQVLQQRTSKPRVRNWNQPDVTAQG